MATIWIYILWWFIYYTTWRYVVKGRWLILPNSIYFNYSVIQVNKIILVYLEYSDVNIMICKARGLVHFGNFSSATLRGTASPVSRFFTITCSKISCNNHTKAVLTSPKKVKIVVHKLSTWLCRGIAHIFFTFAMPKIPQMINISIL